MLWHLYCCVLVKVNDLTCIHLTWLEMLRYAVLTATWGQNKCRNVVNIVYRRLLRSWFFSAAASIRELTASACALCVKALMAELLMNTHHFRTHGMCLYLQNVVPGYKGICVNSLWWSITDSMNCCPTWHLRYSLHCCASGPIKSVTPSAVQEVLHSGSINRIQSRAPLFPYACAKMLDAIKIGCAKLRR